MKPPLSCGAQDLLEAAIIQRRRLNIICHLDGGEQALYDRVLPVDINTHAGQEILTFLTTDNQGGILKLEINTADIASFEAKDYMDPRIHYRR
ncbi:hypothetical protein [Marinicella meishanensis]|uniref:hypothetical protein n=1 Tax=Marinicella meishanensis TaxID=2873263 RepID=UPI001CBDFEA2|nr:hypothetical protein [Marinicella sp. NBU2979]